MLGLLVIDQFQKYFGESRRGLIAMQSQHFSERQSCPSAYLIHH
jgi:hypothetical protein